MNSGYWRLNPDPKCYQHLSPKVTSTSEWDLKNVEGRLLGGMNCILSRAPIILHILRCSWHFLNWPLGRCSTEGKLRNSCGDTACSERPWSWYMWCGDEVIIRSFVLFLHVSEPCDQYWARHRHQPPLWGNFASLIVKIVSSYRPNVVYNKLILMRLLSVL